LANHRSSNQIALMEKENLKLKNIISSLITDDLKNRKHEVLTMQHELEESENLSEMSVSRRCKGSTHCEFCKLKIQLAVNSLGSILDTLKGAESMKS
jgi:hypothetical protein